MNTIRGVPFVLLAFAFAPVASLGLSCRNVVTGDNRDAVSDLCQLLQSCYGNDAVDCNAIRARFGVDHGVDDGFLGFLAEKDCLGSCSLAKACWDHPPICFAEASACHATEDCCGFTSGLGSCADGTCCIPEGVPCEGRESTCCGAQPCRAPEVGATPTCGGIEQCFATDQPCALNADCCSKICDHQICKDKTCSDLGATCHDAGDCCPVDEAAVACTMGKCQVPQCNFDTCGGSPTPCDPNGDPEAQCCGDPTVFCQTDQAGLGGICVHAFDNLPNGYFCTIPSNCCSGYCDTTFFECADVPPVCTPWGGGCGNGESCCEEIEQDTNADHPGECQNSVCVCAGTTTECHSTTEEGAPIACPLESATNEAECVSLVCSLDNFCCCTGWDFKCVGEADTNCNAMPL